MPYPAWAHHDTFDLRVDYADARVLLRRAQNDYYYLILEARFVFARA